MNLSSTPVQISMGQYRALQKSVQLPSPQDLFDYQVERAVGYKLASYEDADRFRKDLPQGLFIFVPQQPKLDNDALKHLMSLVVVNGKTGENYLNADLLKDEVEVPASAHLMVGVEDGDARRNIRPSENRRNIMAEGRQPYNVWRGIIHAIYFPEVLQHHYLDLVASRYGSGFWPDLSLNYGRPGLIAYWSVFASPMWGAPSCGSVIGA